MEDHFACFLDQYFRSDSDSPAIQKWRKHELDGLRRGQEIVSAIQVFTYLDGKRVLDLGCGYGGTSYACAQAGASVAALDYDMHRLAGVRSRQLDHPGESVWPSQAPAEHLPFQSASFDFIICNDVLEHVDNHTLTLLEIRRVLKSDGWLYLSFPNRFSPANFASDPHYGLTGVSILPNTISRWYVVSLRKKSKVYAVGEFPVGSWVMSTLMHLNFEIVFWWPMPRRNLGNLTPLLHFFRLNTQPLITMLCRSLS